MEQGGFPVWTGLVLKDGGLDSGEKCFDVDCESVFEWLRGPREEGAPLKFVEGKMRIGSTTDIVSVSK